MVRKWIASYERKALQKFVDEMIVVSPGIAEAYAPLFRKPVTYCKKYPGSDRDRIIELFQFQMILSYFLSEQKHLGRKLFLYLGTNTQKGRGMDFTFKLVSALPDNYGLVIFGAKNDSELLFLNKKASTGRNKPADLELLRHFRSQFV